MLLNLTDKEQPFQKLKIQVVAFFNDNLLDSELFGHVKGSFRAF